MMLNTLLSKSLKFTGYCLPAKQFKVSDLSLYRNNSTSESHSPVLHEIINNKGILTLNRPKKLNALNRAALDIILNKLVEWENKVDMVIIKSEGRAFCSGGDIVSFVSPGNKQKSKEFLKLEYVMNCYISQYSVPYIAIIDGITMGGGVGLSVHGLVRIATEKTLFAMPETRIGLYTDVGMGHIFSRMPHHLGYYLALCGHRLKGSDVLKAGIATHYIKSENIPSILKGLIELKDPKQNLNNYLYRSTQDVSGIEFSLKPHLDFINETFSAPSVEEIVQRLKKANTEFALETLKLLKQMSPTSLKLTKRLIELYKEKTLEEGLALDNKLGTAAVDASITSDLYEGVRALAIDKDLKPKWNPAELEQVSDAMVERVFTQQLSSEEDFNFTSQLNKLRSKIKS